ncbi:hypothetical protein ACJRO7_014440 [Eucalyptus globulus]|uniref:TIR domain-containing protein n=1 Tax=Eucalyptus globulus TaxID=34317 RepID=A0ABD3L150_EUCGL
MHRLIFGHSFTELMALILLFGLTLYFLKKKKVSARGNAKDADTSAFGLLTMPTGTNSGGSSSSPTEINNGASSSFTAPSGDHYDVFLSFRGLDTREGFTDHLYKGLIDAGIHAFRDNEELRQGEEIGPDLSAAIKNSKILIPILSVNYGSSKWCLDELVQMMECKNDNTETIVLPIFYKVKPADVRYQKGSFGDAFCTREKYFDPRILEKWKQALSKVCSLKAWEAKGYEGELVKSVVQKVLSELKKKFELVIPENLIGIDGHVKKVVEFIDNNSRTTLFVGIHGMGGIGKTTFAKTIYNKLSNQFEHRSFIADIRESWKCGGVRYLQNQLIYDLLKKKNQVRHEDEGIKFLSSMLGSKKVLILLDDVDDDDQLKALAGNHNWFSSGSVIIITTRDESILDRTYVDYKHDHKELDKDKSVILFSRFAFRGDAPPSEFKKLTNDVLSTIGGLPLSLEVLGSLFCGKKASQWGGMIEKLKKVPHKKVQGKLKISYEALDKGQKQIFLDIACFFVGTDKRIASYMWDACEFFPEEGIEVLRFMSLIKIGEDHTLRMHDQLRDLGRWIVREENENEPQYRSRLWDSKEVLKMLEDNEGTEKIEAIYLGKDSSKRLREMADQGDNILTSKKLKKLRNLRFLDASGAHFKGDFNNSVKKLKWLQWQNCPSTFEANNFHLKELLVLNLSASKISDEWQGWSSIMMAEKLKYLDLTSCGYLEKTSFLSAFENLEVLILRDCQRLEHIDSSIGNMKSLLRLDLSGCGRLKGLPAEVGKLKALEQLLLRFCKNISLLSDSIEDLQNLEILDIGWTGIKKLPRGIGRLRNLRDLDASFCTKLGGEMPESIRNLSSLQHLDLFYCKKLQSLSMLPSSLTYLNVTCQSRRLPSLFKLNHLKVLRLICCEFLECIWEHPSTLLEKSLNTPFELEILEMDRCKLMEALDVSQFNHLRTLSAKYCNNILEIRGLDKLNYLESLEIRACSSIKRLDLPKSRGLKIFKAENCENLVEIQGLERLESLEKIDISGCASIARLELPKSGDMKIFKAEKCRDLVEIQGLDRLESLEKINISGCAPIVRLDLPNSKGLKIFDAKTCKNLVEIQGLNRLESLEVIDISGCASIARLDLPKSESLKIFIAKTCENLVEIQGLNRLESLEVIDISGCTSIARLHLPKSEGLKTFNAKFCRNLVEIQGLDRLESLEKINIFGCTSIARLDLPRSEALKIFDAKNCENLVEIQGLDKLESMEEIDISGCASIVRLDLPKSEGLKTFAATNCKNLVEIQGLDRLESLKRMNIYGCTSIQRLDLPKSKGLKELYLGSCKNLFEIQGLDRLEFLKVLDMSGCTSFGRLPDLCCFDTLHDLAINCCDNLHDIQIPERFPFCTSLWIEDCKSLAKFPNLSNFCNLRTLLLSNCCELREIPRLEESTSLKHIAISGCSLIEILPDLSSCTNLISVVVQNCEKLTELRGLEKLEQLVELDISGCKSLKIIPELTGTRIYRNYENRPFDSCRGMRIWTKRLV